MPGWIGLLALPSLERWGPILLVLPIGLATALVVQRSAGAPPWRRELHGYVDVHGADLLSLGVPAVRRPYRRRTSWLTAR